ncbi:MAG: acetyltransferase [Candidatus Sericytochromatia bacterium]|nr:acetyltransferase [Candidatus Sericytochromatia bacterium]
MDKLIIWGATGQALVIEELISNYKIEIVAFFENNINVISPIENLPIYYGIDGFKKWIKQYPNHHNCYFLVAIGGANGQSRKEISLMLKGYGFKPYTAIHSTAYVATNAQIGEGSQILAKSVVCAKVKIGNYCIINTACNIDHECIIGNYVHIGPGATLAGCIEIKDNTFVGSNATILPKLKIGKNVIIGAGAVVTKNVADNSMLVGNPAKII